MITREEVHWSTLDRGERQGYIDSATSVQVDYREPEARESRLREAQELAWNDTPEGQAEIEERRRAARERFEMEQAARKAERFRCFDCDREVTRDTAMFFGFSEIAQCADCLRADGLGHLVTWE